MARQRLRLIQVRKPESFDDQKAPLDIKTSGELGIDSQEQFEYLISQIRQILGTDDWKDAVPRSLVDLAVIEKCDVELIGAKDGVNVTFTTPDYFRADSFKLYVNGLRQARGLDCDYEIAESGGLGTGYDTVVLDSRLAPYIGESVVADYIVK